MITVKELFQQIDRKRVCTEYLKLWSDISEDEYDKLIVKLSSFIDKLLKIEATPCDGKIVLCPSSYMRYEDHSSPSSTVYYKDEILEYFTPIKSYDDLDGYDLEKLSDDEIEKLKTEFPLDWQDRIERVSEYVASTGKHYSNFLAVIRAWAKKDRPKIVAKNDVQSGLAQALELLGVQDG